MNSEAENVLADEVMRIGRFTGEMIEAIESGQRRHRLPLVIVAGTLVGIVINSMVRSMSEETTPEAQAVLEQLKKEGVPSA